MKTANYTFDQDHIQEDRTGTFRKDIEVTANCRAFTGEPVKEHCILIGADKTLRVWDPVAGHFTMCHILSRPTQRRIIRRFVK